MNTLGGILLLLLGALCLFVGIVQVMVMVEDKRRFSEEQLYYDLEKARKEAKEADKEKGEG